MRGRLAVLAALAGLALSPPAPVAGQDTHVLVVTGLGGAPPYGARFADWGGRLRAAALEGGVAADRVTWLAERTDVAPGVDGVARVEVVARSLAGIAERSAPGDVVVLALFGHGSARGGETRLNLPGPDLSGVGLAALLEPLSDRRVVVVNAASASGGFIEPLSAPGRVVITATRSPGEAQATRFGEYFVAALEGAADTDKDGRITMLEAFEYARREVARSFEEGGHLPTEHALLEDDGDGQGSLEPTGSGDGRLAATVTLAPPRTPAGAASPEVAALQAEAVRLRAELDALRGRQAEMTGADYQAALEALLLEIARNGRALRAAEGGDGAGDGGGGGS